MTAIHPSAVIDADVELGQDVEIGPFCVIGPGVRIGARTRIASHVVIEGPSEVGADCVIHSGAVLGGAPQHAAYANERTSLRVGDRSIVREHVTLHRGTAQGRGVTQIGADAYLMAGAHVGHDCVLGDHVTMANGAVLGGHVQVGDFVIVGGLAAVHQRARIGRHAFVGGMAGINHDLIPYGSAWGNHAHLEGLNLVGLKRRGLPRERINALRAGFKCLFWSDGPFEQRVEATAAGHAGSPEVMEIIEFIRGPSARPITMPRGEPREV
ncbi:MAG: acyl-ACP--UDP-N-acetylglucosamine O-acyltransferase [Alphaproteobacteria bacterium]|nr:acyl-ACP--UDP-N-acetylglucosamine O-acyltransferase [Alphaproteobacteria bacterium]